MKTRQPLTLAAIAMLAISTTGSLAQQKQSIRDRAVGTWKLLSYETVRSDGQVLNIIMGPHPTGIIIYHPNGYMTVQIMHDPRPMFAESGLTATRDELRNAYFGYYAYWGAYTVNEAESTVEHNIRSSLRPEEVGLKYKRFLSFSGTKLVLTTPKFKAGPELLAHAEMRKDEEVVNRLTWERIE
jgi:hypothetical protein